MQYTGSIQWFVLKNGYKSVPLYLEAPSIMCDWCKIKLHFNDNKIKENETLMMLNIILYYQPSVPKYNQPIHLIKWSK